MSLHEPLSPELEAQAQELAARIRDDDDILALARLLVSKTDHDIFGQTEFQARDLVHRLGAHAFAERLKKSQRLPRLRYRLPPLSAHRQVPKATGRKRR